MVLKVTNKMRLQARASIVNVEEVKRFLEWIILLLRDGEGGPNDGEVDIDILEDLLVDGRNDPTSPIVAST